MFVVRSMATYAPRRQCGGLRCLSLVTPLARRSFVLSSEAIVSLRVVVKAPTIPTDRIVAGRTVLTEATAMHVILCMAGRAVRSLIQECGCCMAFLAVHARVLSKQWKIRKLVIETDVDLPIPLAVALTAAVAQLTLMWIIIPMATHAARRGSPHMDGLLVAALALRCHVSSVQCEVGVTIVLKAYARPATFRMTIGAVRAKESLVLVVHLVATIAGAGGLPFLDGLCVATCAGCPIVPFVGVILSVATVAVTWQRCGDVFHMAGLALRGRMPAYQCKAFASMIEALHRPALLDVA